MTLTDALNKAALLGLDASEDDGYCTLRRPGGGIAARGGTFEEAFARLEAAEASARSRAAQRPPEPPTAPPPNGCLF